MPSARSRILRTLCVGYVTATAVHIGWVMAHEPFFFDAWNVAQDTQAKPFSLGRFFAYWKFEYTHSNPRLGQAFTYLAYKLQYFAVIASPIAFLALALGAFVVGTGRWPSWRRGRDLALSTIAIGFLWFALPQIGKTMFCRAYGANYLYGAVITLWFLVPLRLSATGRASAARYAAYALFGIAAGLCNEHTGPSLCAFMVLYAWWTQRRTKQTPTLLWAGAAGAVIGFALIFFAPGQGQRYEGLAQRVSLAGRLLQRGIVGNLDIYRDLILAAAPLLALITIVSLVGFSDDETRPGARRALRVIALAMIASTTVTMTIFVSPKLGPRFFLLPMALLLAGFLALADAVLTSPRRLAPFVVLAVAASAYAATRTIPLFYRASKASDARIAALEASKPGTVFTADSFEQIEDTWWFYGDDFRDIRKREMVAKYFDLKEVIFRAYDPSAPLGVSDVRLVARTGGACLDRFELGYYRGLDVATILDALKKGAERLDDKPPSVDLTVQFVGERPVLPRPTLLVGRWTPRGIEGWAGAIARKTRSTKREVVLPKEFPSGMELYIYQVGGEARLLDATRSYVPWKTGAYWVLACNANECFVIAATRLAR